MFKLTVHFKHEMIRMWQRFDQKFELGFNRVGFIRARPVLTYIYVQVKFYL